MASVCVQGTLDSLFTRLYPEGRRTPNAMSAELTHRCNFGCPHCYCRLPQDGPTPRAELSTEQWKRIISEAVNEGVLFALFTGGEPLLREDFRELWRFGRERGLINILFTNGSLIDAKMADFLAEWTPRQISVTLYGATEETYRQMTGQRGMHQRALEAVDLLRERGLPLDVRSIITRTNRHEVPALREQSARYQKIFMWDAELIGSYPTGQGHPASVRLSAQELFDIEYEDEVRLAEWHKMVAAWKPAPPQPDYPFRCGVLKSEFHLDPYGGLHPCLGLESISLDLLHMSVHEAWEALPEALLPVIGEPGPCQSCGLPPICRQCPADALLEGKPAGWPLPERCEMARLRAEAFGLPPPPTCAAGAKQTFVDNDSGANI
ncbi:MAG: radical SAM protein [Armatimonadota bacterium]